MSAITAKARRKMKKYAVLTREPRCFLGSFDFSWEQRKFGEVFDCTVPNNTLSRVELSYDEGTVLNVHYGDVLIKYGSVLDVQKDDRDIPKTVQLFQYPDAEQLQYAVPWAYHPEGAGQGNRREVHGGRRTVRAHHERQRLCQAAAPLHRRDCRDGEVRRADRALLLAHARRRHDLAGHRPLGKRNAHR